MRSLVAKQRRVVTADGRYEAVFFDFDKAVLKPDGKAKLDDIASKTQGTDLEVIIAPRPSADATANVNVASG